MRQDDAAPVDDVEEYRRTLGVLKAGHRAAAQRAARAMIGRCFKSVTPSDTVYVAVLALDDAGGLSGWHFQKTATGDIQVRENDDLQVGFLAESCAEISRNEFVAAFNELLTSIARYASRIPIP